MVFPLIFFATLFIGVVFILDIDYQALGKRISNLRRQKKLTQEELAEKTDLSTNYISHIENSRSIPSLETLMKLLSLIHI